MKEDKEKADMEDNGDGDKNQPVDLVLNYTLTQLTVFMLEDGAAILLLLKNPSMELLESLSLYLTLISAAGFILVIAGYLALALCGVICDKFDLGCNGCLGAALATMVCAFPSFLIATLLQEVLMKENDNPISGGLELACYIVYGIGASLLGLFTTLALFGAY